MSKQVFITGDIQNLSIGTDQSTNKRIRKNWSKYCTKLCEAADYGDKSCFYSTNKEINSCKHIEPSKVLTNYNAPPTQPIASSVLFSNHPNLLGNVASVNTYPFVIADAPIDANKLTSGIIAKPISEVYSKSPSSVFTDSGGCVCTVQEDSDSSSEK